MFNFNCNRSQFIGIRTEPLNQSVLSVKANQFNKLKVIKNN